MFTSGSSALLGSGIAAILATWWVWAPFLAAAVLLDFFDISLPRGDSTGVTGALLAATVGIIGAIPAGIIGIVSAVVAHFARQGTDSPRRMRGVIISRVGAVAASAALLAWLSTSGLTYAIEVLLPAVYLISEMLLLQWMAMLTTGRPFAGLVRGNLKSQFPLMAAQWSASALLLLTYPSMLGWSLLPVVALLLLMRQSFAMFLDIRETYRTTVEVLVEAAESQDERRMGHADRTAILAREIAGRLGLSSSEVERISYAALLHDLGELSVGPGEIEPTGQRVPAAEVIGGVEFFARVKPVLELCDGRAAASGSSDDDLLAAMVVALAGDIDAGNYPEVAEAHRGSALDVVAPLVSFELKAKAVSAALRLGHRIPAVS